MQTIIVAKTVKELDGRKSRTLRSRVAISEACLDLILEGTLQPSSSQIADRAGVSRRSIFNHFADLAELYDAVVEVGAKRSAFLLEEISVDEPIAERLEHLIDVRTKFLEATAAVTRALTAQALVGPASDQAIRVSKERLRRRHKEVERLFGEELVELSAGERSEVLEAMSAAMAPLLWETLRARRGHSVARAKSVVGRMVRGVLRDAGVDI